MTTDRRVRKFLARGLYEAYASWCEDAGVRFPLTKTAFGIRLKKRGFRAKKSGSERLWRGLDLRDSDRDDDELAA